MPNTIKNVTGMVATDKGIFVVQGGDTDQVTFDLLDANCKAEPNIFSGANPLNPQDLGFASDGSVVVADIGDTDDSAPSRPRIAIETAQPDGNTAKTFRFQYPGGAKYDAQAMVLDKGDVPIVFAHEPNGVTGIYKPATALVAEITDGLPQLAAGIPVLSEESEAGEDRYLHPGQHQHPQPEGRDRQRPGDRRRQGPGRQARGGPDLVRRLRVRGRRRR